MKTLLPVLLRLTASALARTWRIEIVGGEHLEAARSADCGIVFALWHARLLPLCWHHRGESMHMLVSANRDGGYLSRVARRWGYRIIEGSSSKGGAAGLRRVISALRSGGEVAITPDGPRGPARIPHPGALAAASAASAVVVPVTASAKWNIRFNSWDGFVLPLPFSRVRIAYAAPCRAGPDKARSGGLEGLKRNLDHLEAMVDWPVRIGLSRMRPLPGLAPFSHIYRLGSRAVFSVRSRRAARLALPSVLVGGLTTGGDGKTPLAAWLAARLKERGARPAVLTRDYGGDESVVHSNLAPGLPVVVNADRHRGAENARRAGADCLVLDGGFQRSDIRATRTIAAVDCRNLLAPRRLLPAGIWREPLEALSRADLVVLTDKDASDYEMGRATAMIRTVTGVDPLVAHLRISGLRSVFGPVVELRELAGKRVLACAGVAQPGPFFGQVRALGAYVTELPFGDHHHFSNSQIKVMVQLSRFVDYVVVTLKDAVKLKSVWPDDEKALLVAELNLEWDANSRSQIDSVLDRVVSSLGTTTND